MIVIIDVDLDSIPHCEEIESASPHTSRATIQSPSDQLMVDYRSTDSTNIIHILAFLVISYLIYMSVKGVEHSEIQGTAYTLLTVLGMAVAASNKRLDR